MHHANEDAAEEQKARNKEWASYMRDMLNKIDPAPEEKAPAGTCHKTVECEGCHKFTAREPCEQNLGLWVPSTQVSRSIHNDEQVEDDRLNEGLEKQVKA